jgi:hypothetical protein
MKTLALAIASTAFVAGAALAGDAKFTAADTNGDGALTLDEVAIAMPEATPDAFATADLDQSGTLTEDEFVAAVNGGVLPSSG